MQPRDCDLRVFEGGGALLLPLNGVARLALRYAPARGGSAYVLVSLLLRPAFGGGGSVLAGCAVRLRCADPAAVDR